MYPIQEDLKKVDSLDKISELVINKQKNLSPSEIIEEVLGVISQQYKDVKISKDDIADFIKKISNEENE